MPASILSGRWWSKDVCVIVVSGEHANQHGWIKEMSADGSAITVEVEAIGQTITLPSTWLEVRCC
jgi:hypothetical protein